MKYMLALALLPTLAHAAPYTLTNPQGTFSTVLEAEVVATEAARQQGLMGRTNLCPNCAMVFEYPELTEPQTLYMWMRNTPLPLDMLFMRGNVVAGIHANATPFDETIIASPPDVTGVVEVHGGWAAAHGVSAGWVLAPALPPASRTSTVGVTPTVAPRLGGTADITAPHDGHGRPARP